MSGGTIDLVLDRAPSAEDLARLRSGLNEHAREFVAEPGFEPLAVFAREVGGRLAGGAYGYP